MSRPARRPRARACHAAHPRGVGVALWRTDASHPSRWTRAAAGSLPGYLAVRRIQASARAGPWARQPRRPCAPALTHRAMYKRERERGRCPFSSSASPCSPPVQENSASSATSMAAVTTRPGKYRTIA
jgi:hypothetical protein